MLSRALQSLDLETLKAERASCLTALLAVARGEKVKSTSFDGRAVEYAPSDQANLEQLIAALDEAILAKESPIIAARRPMLPRWG